MKKTFAKIFLVFAAIMVTGYVISTTVSAASFFGAIFTTLGDGTAPVNQNIYDSKADVYLNGGPQNDNAHGLPVGTYYFQVTDPNGGTLLSTDPAACRQVVVALSPDLKGRIMGVASGRPTFCTDGTTFPPDFGTPDTGDHFNGTQNLTNFSIPVQLMPFNNTGNPGGEYKAWLIRQTDKTSIDTNDSRRIIFNDNDAKTDNFKVKIDCTENCDPTPTPTPPPDTFTISGSKFFDINANGVNDGADFPLGGFLIQTYFDPALIGGNPVNRLTLGDGTWAISGIPNLTDFWVWEVVPNACNAPAGSYWQQTFPTTLINPPGAGAPLRGHEGTIDGLDVTGLDFGNRCQRAGTGGLTIGFWSNKNGQALETSVDFTALNGFNLVNANGSSKDFNGTLAQNKTAFNIWLLSANATNMAYMLSAQMSGTYLNVAHVKIDGNALLDVGGQIGTINAWITEANSSLGSFPNTTAAGTNRTNQERLKNIFDSINNNNFVFIQAGCTACYPQ